MGGDDDVDMTLVTRNFNLFLKNKTVAKKVDKRNEKPQSFECKGFDHMRNESLNKEKEEEN